MEGQKKGGGILAVVAAAIAIGALLLFGVKSANNQGATQALAVPTQALIQPTAVPSVPVDTQLQNADTEIGGLDTYQKNIDSAINDKPIDNGL